MKIGNMKIGNMKILKKKKLIPVFLVAILVVMAPLSMAVPSTTNSGKGQPSVPPKIAPKEAVPHILVYADDAYHLSPNTYIDKALQSLGLSYTAFYNGDFNGFNTALTGGTWDLVIFGQENYFVDATTLGNLSTYVSGGGKLIAESWNMGSYSANPLWTTMGVQWISDDNNPPDPVYWWLASHPIVSGVPFFTSLIGARYGIYGQYVNPLSGTTAIGGYTTTPSPNNAALVLRNDGKTLFRGFMDGQNDADLNSNGIPDGQELWEKSISYMITTTTTLPEMVFAKGSDSALWYRTYDGVNWGPWTSLGGILSSDPEAGTWFNKVIVFVKGTDSALWYRTYDGTAWSPWTSLGGIVASGAGAS